MGKLGELVVKNWSEKSFETKTSEHTKAKSSSSDPGYDIFDIYFYDF